MIDFDDANSHNNSTAKAPNTNRQDAKSAKKKTQDTKQIK